VHANLLEFCTRAVSHLFRILFFLHALDFGCTLFVLLVVCSVLLSFVVCVFAGAREPFFNKVQEGVNIKDQVLSCNMIR